MLSSKKDIRIKMLSKRAGYNKNKKERDLFKIRKCILENLQIESNTIIAGYFPILGEVDIKNILYKFSNMGATLLLPVIEKNKMEMNFHNWIISEPLETGPFNTLQPSDDNEVFYPDVVFVPLLAFDYRGYRVGYGKGFYDKIIRRLKEKKDFVAYGIAYDWQEIPLVPKDEFDMPLDGVFTPKRFLKVSKA